jgi:hypothetical protein
MIHSICSQESRGKPLHLFSRPQHPGTIILFCWKYLKELIDAYHCSQMCIALQRYTFFSSLMLHFTLFDIMMPCFQVFLFRNFLKTATQTSTTMTSLRALLLRRLYSAAEVNIIVHFMSKPFSLFDSMMPCLFHCRILSSGIALYL